ncbi:MAG TPA: SGNH/GDSL hydrolase family protein [Terracidiphilus sp.]|nr:SGNH/GDSL hydrolase family protein [Terracidiphilus sp.]
MAQEKITFGIYPGSNVGQSHMVQPDDKADDPAKIQTMLDRLHGDKPFIVRGYVHYLGGGKIGNRTPESVEQYAVHGRKLDVVLCRQTDEEDVSGWLDFIAERIAHYGARLDCLQITEEPNLTSKPLDGQFKGVKKALVAGVVHAKREALGRGLDIKVGFNTTLSFMPQDTFWADLGNVTTPEFHEALDYVGLDFFPDVFRPIEPDRQAQLIELGLRKFREKDLPQARIYARVPIRITETGWPTSSARSAEKQAETLNRAASAVRTLADELNITHLEWFSLRDFDSDKDDIWYQWGILEDDYSPKPAFELCQRMIKDT